MWHSRQQESEPGQLEQVRIDNAAGDTLSYREVLHLWRDNEQFSRFFSQQLAASSLSAYLWETPPISEGTLDRPFEYTLTGNQTLENVRPDMQAFAEYFDGADASAMARFDNLGGDARLVAPCPLAAPATCTHLGGFVRHAPAEALVALWRAVAEEALALLSEKPLWISTCGLGVYWLHVRLDSYPKYYQHAPYRHFEPAR